MSAPREIDRAKVLNELMHRWYETAAGMAGEDPGMAWVLDQVADLGHVAFQQPVDDPSKDLVGTVRRQDHEDGGYTVWECVLGRRGRNRHWRATWATELHLTGWVWKDHEVARFPVVGAVPYSPAWLAEQEVAETGRVSEDYPPGCANQWPTPAVKEA